MFIWQLCRFLVEICLFLQNWLSLLSSRVFYITAELFIFIIFLFNNILWTQQGIKFQWFFFKMKLLQLLSKDKLTFYPLTRFPGYPVAKINKASLLCHSGSSSNRSTDIEMQISIHYVAILSKLVDELFF